MVPHLFLCVDLDDAPSKDHSIHNYHCRSDLILPRDGSGFSLSIRPAGNVIMCEYNVCYVVAYESRAARSASFRIKIIVAISVCQDSHRRSEE